MKSVDFLLTNEYSVLAIIMLHNIILLFINSKLTVLNRHQDMRTGCQGFAIPSSSGATIVTAIYNGPSTTTEATVLTIT